MKRLFLIRIVSILFLLSLYVAPVQAASPSFFFSSPPKQIHEGDRFTLSVDVQSSSDDINAVTGSVSFPAALIRAVSVSKTSSVINLWTQDPSIKDGKIPFEGVILNPGFRGEKADVFDITFEARKAGTATVSFSEGAVLANDGLGTNILTTLGSTSFDILSGSSYLAELLPGNERLAALPVITDYSAASDSSAGLYVKGKGEPDALTKISFKDVSAKSIGERLIAVLQTKKKKLDDVLVKNDNAGAFEYISPKNLVAGVYNATPFLVDQNDNSEKPGLGVQLLVSDSKIVKALVVLLNVLGLLIPIVGLMVIIYFIPWYSFRRMRVLKKKLGLEEEKIDIAGRGLEREEKVLDNRAGDIRGPEQS